jgi:hypothetical protein
MAEKLGAGFAGIKTFKIQNNFSPETTMPQQQKHATLCKSEHSSSVCPSIVIAAFAFWQLHWGLCEVVWNVSIPVGRVAVPTGCNGSY